MSTTNEPVHFLLKSDPCTRDKHHKCDGRRPAWGSKEEWDGTRTCRCECHTKQRR